ncbi:MAG: DUF4343 domain-containing protein [Planctomycetota bacterium]|nr:MAG: DUF4343 domain-containing protein [Planctomycetota bacterium]
MQFQDLLLIISNKPDRERDAVAEVWEVGGGEVLRLGRFWDPPPVERDRVRVYGSDSFSMVLAQRLDLELTSPRDEMIAELDASWLKRDLRAMTLADLAPTAFPIFVKPVTPKLFRASVYESHPALVTECQGLEDSTAVLVSEIVTFEAEARTFVLEGEALTCSVYEGTADATEAKAYVNDLVQAAEFPNTCVLDVGLIAGRGWALVEANAAWGAGLNGCDPLEAAKCIARASKAR